MLSFEDQRWTTLKGGYHVPYDPRPALMRLEAEESVVVTWKELWNELHHQGDVDDASYAVVPHLVRIYVAKSNIDWNFYAIVSTIEIERHRRKNPSLPDWLAEDYFQAWNELVRLALRDFPKVQTDVEVKTILGALAIAKKQLKLAALISNFDDAEIDEFLEDQLAWSQIYDERR
ncbi:MAG: hypothetical protein L0Z71_03965 [Anaerolineae bacterium]|nr:hypothetical protein [Anaerolineae bacterium]